MEKKEYEQKESQPDTQEKEDIIDNLDNSNTISENGELREKEDSSTEDKDSAEEIESELEKENLDLKDKLLRSLADNENVRKQSEKIRLEAIKYGVQPLARELLDVVDNFERALENKEKTDKETLLDGFLLIQKEVINILEKFKIKKINAHGEQFDANFHQAMFEKPTDTMVPGKVCEIVQDGYLFHDRLLRPSLVGVAKKIEQDETLERAEEKDNITEESGE